MAATVVPRPTAATAISFAGMSLMHRLSCKVDSGVPERLSLGGARIAWMNVDQTTFG